MKDKSVKIVACAFVAAVVFTGVNIEAKAGNVSSVLPAGGVNLSMMRDTSLESILAMNGSARQVEATVTRSQVMAAQEAARQEARRQEEEKLKNMVIAQVNNYVNVRSLPSEEGEVLGKLYDESAGVLISEENGWYQITSGNVTGYVKADYCVTGEAAAALAKEVGKRLATVETTTLFVRMEPSREAEIIGMVPEGDQLLVLEETEDWVKVNIEEGDGWISKEYVSIQTEFVQAESKAEEEARLVREAQERQKAREAAEKKAQQENEKGSELGKAVAEYALQFVGNPYKWGGTSLTDGADCSGFVMSVYANFGVSLPHSSGADRKQGYAVDGLENAQPGDLICYSGHVALYIGDGQIVHASNKKTGIIVSNADYKTILAIRRIF